MAISLVGFSRVAVADASENTTITGTLPAGGANGNLLVAYLASNDALNPSSLTHPDGWNAVTDNYSANGNFNIHGAIAWVVRADALDLEWTIGGDSRDDQVIITEWSGDWDTESPITLATIAASANSTSFTSPTQTTTVDGSIYVAGCGAKNGPADAAIYPDGMTGIVNERSRANSFAVRSALAYQVIATAGATGTKEWTNFLNASNYGNPLSFVINHSDTPVGPEITAVNGDDTVSDASSGNTVTTSLGLDSVSAIVIRDADLNETAGSSISGSGTDWTFATPAIADRSAAYYGSATLVLTGVYDSDPVELEFPITFNQPSGLDLTTLAADPNTTDQAVGYGIITIAEGGQYAVDPAEAVVFTDALGYTIGDQSAQIAYVYDGTMTVFTLLTGSEASAGGFTAQGFTSQGFTAQGFTSRGFA